MEEINKEKKPRIKDEVDKMVRTRLNIRDDEQNTSMQQEISVKTGVDKIWQKSPCQKQLRGKRYSEHSYGQKWKTE